MGQNSCLFAVRVQIQPKELQAETKNETVAEPKTEPKCDQTEEVNSEAVAETQDDGEAAEEGSANKRSEYFVYCNRCEDFEEGKLRVRCDTCLSGAFIVFRDPESWEDVLTPKQVNNDENPCTHKSGLKFILVIDCCRFLVHVRRQNVQEVSHSFTLNVQLI